MKVTKKPSFLTRSTTSTSTLRINESTTVFERFMSLRIEIGEIMNWRRSIFFVALNSLTSANCFFLRKEPLKSITTDQNWLIVRQCQGDLWRSFSLRFLNFWIYTIRFDFWCSKAANIRFIAMCGGPPTPGCNCWKSPRYLLFVVRREVAEKMQWHVMACYDCKVLMVIQ